MTSHVLVDYDGTERLLGGKSGYTPDAGRCLASIGKVDGMNVVLVTAFSGFPEGPLLDVSSLHTWLEKNYDRTVVVDASKLLQTISLEDAKEEEPILLYPSETLTYDCKKDGEIKEEIHDWNELNVYSGIGYKYVDYGVREQELFIKCKWIKLGKISPFPYPAIANPTYPFRSNLVSYISHALFAIVLI